MRFSGTRDTKRRNNKEIVICIYVYFCVPTSVYICIHFLTIAIFTMGNKHVHLMDIMHFNQQLHDCAVQKNLKRAVRVWNFVNGTKSTVRPTIITYHAMLRVCLCTEAYRKAMEVWQNLDGPYSGLKIDATSVSIMKQIQEKYNQRLRYLQACTTIANHEVDEARAEYTSDTMERLGADDMYFSMNEDGSLH